MSERGANLKVEFSMPQNGWIELTVATPAQSLREVVSYTPNDFVLELTTALSLAMQGCQGEAIAHCEPTTFSLTFSPSNREDVLLLQILKYADWQRNGHSASVVLAIEASKLNVVLPFWRALRQLEGQVSATQYREAMRMDFPSTALQRLTQVVSALRER